MPVAEVEKTFAVSGLPRPSTVAPNQPYPHKWIYKYWLLFLAVAMLAGFVMLIASGSTREVFSQSISLPPLAECRRNSSVL